MMDAETRKKLRHFQIHAICQQRELLENPPVTRLEQLKRLSVYHATVMSLCVVVNDALWSEYPPDEKK